VPALSEDAWNLVQIKRKEEEAEEAAWAAQDEAAAAGDAGVGYGQDDGEEEDEGQGYYGNEEEEEEYEEELMREVGSLLVLSRDVFLLFLAPKRPFGRITCARSPRFVEGYAENRLTKAMHFSTTSGRSGSFKTSRA
jgi:hypothetical protein